MQRSEILRKVGQLSRERAQEIGRNMTLDQGQPLAESVGEVMACADHADWHAEECRRIYGRVILPRRPEVRQMVFPAPIGVCPAFTTWTFPYNQHIHTVFAAHGAGCHLIPNGHKQRPATHSGGKGWG